MKAVLKFLKRIFWFIVGLSTLVSILVFVFEDDVVAFFKREASKQLNTTIDTKVKMSFWKTFPNISIEMERPVILDAVKGSKDTLLKADELYLSFDILKLIKKEFIIHEINLEGGHLYLKVDEEGNNNYTILKTKKEDSKPSSISLALGKVILNKVRVHYINQSVKNNHDVFAEYAEADLLLNDSLVQFTLEGDLYAHHITVNKHDYIYDKTLILDAGCVYVFKEKYFQIKPSELSINGAGFSISGDVFNASHSMDLSFEAQKNDVKNILALLPKKVSDELNHYESEGNVNFSGQIKGKYGKKDAPELKIQFGFENASIYHPETGKKVEHLYMRGEYGNGEKKNNKTSYVKVFGLKGVIDDNKFNANVRVDDFNNPYLTLELKAQAKIASLLEFYPIDGINVNSGKLGLDLDFKGKIKYLKKGDFLEKVYSKGSLELMDCSFRTKKDKLAYSDFNGKCLFNNNSLGITNLSGKIGNSDFKTSGLFKNFFSYLLLDNQRIDIQADFVSGFIDLDELLAVNTKKVTPKDIGEDVKYEFSLDKRLKASCSINVNRLKFREFKNENIARHLKGEFFIEVGKIRYSNLQGEIADGSVSMNGEIDARNEDAILVYNYGKVNDFNVSKGFLVLEDFGQEFLTHKNLDGKLDAMLTTKLHFDKHLKLDLEKLESTISANITDGELKDFAQMIEMEKVLKKYMLTKYLKSRDLSRVKFDEMSNTVYIKDEVVYIPQMRLGSSASSDITLNGEHKFNNEFDYDISFPLVNYKKMGRQIDKGIHTKDETDNLYVFVRVFGTPDDYDIVYNKKEIIKSAVSQVNPMHTLKEAFKKDSLEGVTETIELDDNVDSTEVMYLEDF